MLRANAVVSSIKWDLWDIVALLIPSWLGEQGGGKAKGIRRFDRD